MEDLRTDLLNGGRMSDLAQPAKDRIVAAGFNEVEYLELRCGNDLSLLDETRAGARLFGATWLAGVRLIDNIAV
jgi:pantoate--beta-alanine ligase